MQHDRIKENGQIHVESEMKHRIMLWRSVENEMTTRRHEGKYYDNLIGVVLREYILVC